MVQALNDFIAQVDGISSFLAESAAEVCRANHQHSAVR